MKTYDAELHYGWQRSHETYDTYHAFELTDPHAPVDDDELEKKLAGLLDTTPEDDDFDCRTMNVKIPDSIVSRIQSDFINEIIKECGGNKERAYELFKLWWMLKHGHTLADLMAELNELRYADPEDSDRISTPETDIFLDWESDSGFGGEIWPCFEEFLGCEYKAAMQDT